MKLGAVKPEEYDVLLQEKVSNIQNKFAHLFNVPSMDIYASIPLHFRMRVEFKIWHQNQNLHYAMFHSDKKAKPYFIENFPIASLTINQLMPKLMRHLRENQVLSKRLFQVEFLTTQTNSVLITLIYHRKLDEVWVEHAKELEVNLKVSIIGRARKQKLVISKDYVSETFIVDQKSWHYRQYENSFTQPNATINEKMLSWVTNIVKNKSDNQRKDLIELYCGNGNFTCVLAPHFNKVLATEISKISVNSAQYNLSLNKVSNATVVRLSSEEFVQAKNKERPFRRLSNIDLESYHFETIFVDPPRCGLDVETLKLVQQFDRILYISCNPETLQSNIEALVSTHKIKRFAIFDQFPYTQHVECGVYLERLGES